MKVSAARHNKPRSRKSAWELRLYVADMTPRSLRAVANLKNFAQEQLNGNCKLEVIDVLAHPQAAQADNIVALPTLVRRSPRPARRMIGDLSDTARLLSLMDVQNQA